MISTSNLSVQFGSRKLFDEVNIKFTEGNCYGIIGPNGAGKSTFLKVLTGEMESTSGEVIIDKGKRLSFLKQDHFAYEDEEVLNVVMMGHARLYDIMKQKEALYSKEEFTEEDGKTCFKARDNEEFCEKIRNIVENNVENLDEITETAYNIAVERDLLNIGKKYKEYYEHILNQKNR